MGQSGNTLAGEPALRAQGSTYGGLTGYQWLVVGAAWLGWGFDVFDGLLFNYVASTCLPDLLGVGPKDPAVAFWNGLLTSLLLVGWGIGGILFGKVSDRIGRSKTLLLTIVLYSVATAGCAFSQNIWMLAAFRLVSSLGIGGEWAAGASLVAETVPEKKRVWAGMLLYTASPFGIFLATMVSDVFLHQVQFENAGWGWRAVFLTGLVPAAFAVLIRMKVKEPENWRPSAEAGRIGALFEPSLLRKTIGGLCMAIIALLGWWSCFAFLPHIATRLATSPEEASSFKAIGTNAYSLGGLLGTLLTLPVAVTLGRRWMFALYFAFSAVAVYAAFGLAWEPQIRMYMMFPVGIGVFGVFGAFTFYLPELFPMRLRSTGAGFCYNTGRFIAALGPFAIGAITNMAPTPADQLPILLRAVSWIAIFPALGVALVLMGFCQETKGQSLADCE
jgi:MFS family permease